MFIKECKTTDKKSKRAYYTHKLVESYRNIDGKPRQRVVMSLGTLDLPRIRWRELASILETRISGQLSFLEDEEDISCLADNIMKHNKFLKSKDKEKNKNDSNSDIKEIDMNSLNTSLLRSLGPELVANSFWNKLQFNEMLMKLGFNEKEISFAKAIIIGRLINPDSEFATWKWFQNNTALVEMTPVDISAIGKDSFYEIGDLLLANKESLEQKLYEIESSIFSNGNNVLLYDLTNAYFEGNCKNNSRAKRGHSKEKRTDCPLVTLAIVIDSQGFPIFSNIYDGNKGEPSTLVDVLNQLDKNCSSFKISKKPILIMDRGIATKDNIKLIIEKDYPYTVVSRRESEKDFSAEFERIKEFMKKDQTENTDSKTDEILIPEGWMSIDKEKEVFVKKILSKDNCYVLSVSVGRTIKEQSMDLLKETRFLEEMNKLKKSFEKKRILLPQKIGERIGRIKGKFPTASKFYEITINTTKDYSKVTEIIWTKKEQKKERLTLTGCYVIETTQINLSPIEIWKQYIQLTRVESTFKDLKSELGLRPIYHQKSNRTESHLFIGVLAYHLLNSIECSLRAGGNTNEWKTIKKILSTHQRSTTILNGSDKKVYHVRTSSLPEPHHNEIYRVLKIKDTLKPVATCILQRL